MRKHFSSLFPKAGQLWECVDRQIAPIGTIIDIKSTDPNDKTVEIQVNDFTIITLRRDTFLESFKFHSNPSNMYPTETLDENPPQIGASEMIEQPISERKRESFRFYDKLPPELARQAKENFREDTCENVPTNLFEAIQYGWWWSESKHGNFSSWCRVRDNAQNGKYNLSEAHSSVIIDPMKHELIALYEKMDENGKALMRKEYPNVEFPKVKEYVSYNDYNQSEMVYFDSYNGNDNLPCVLKFKNCTPEVVGDEIRFVKD